MDLEGRGVSRRKMGGVCLGVACGGKACSVV